MELGPQPGSEDIAAAADQQGHLVGDHGHITGGGGQHRGLPYAEASLVGSYAQAVRHLHTVGTPLRPAAAAE